MGGRDGSDKRLLRGFGGTLEEVSLSDEARNRDRAGLLVGGDSRRSAGKSCLWIKQGWGGGGVIFFFSSILGIGGEAGECPLPKPLVCAELSF